MAVQFVCGDILDQPAQTLVLPCNGSGIMGFVSLAGEVRRRMGRRLYETYRALCPMKVGDVKLIDAPPGAAQESVMLACTMIWPGTPIPIEHVQATARNILQLAEEKGIASLAWPLLGSGGGRVPPWKSFEAILKEIEAFAERGYEPQIHIVEKDPHKYQALVRSDVRERQIEGNRNQARW